MGSGQSTTGQTNTPRTRINENYSRPKDVEKHGVGIDTVVGSAELCDVCKNPENEVVGFCKHCKQNYCSKCRHCKENVEPGQADRSGGKQMRASLFEKQLVPADVQTIPYDSLKENERKNSVICLGFSESSEEIFMFDKQPSGVMLKVMKKRGSTIIDLHKDIAMSAHMFSCFSSSKTDTCIYYTFGMKFLMKMIIDKVQNCSKQRQYFNTSGECYGIAKFDNGFALSVKLITGFDIPDWQVQYLDKDGKIKKQIVFDNDGNALFSCPYYLVSNHSQDILFVSDSGKKAVIALNVHGDVLFTFSHIDLKRPTDLTVDEEDNVYVANGENVVQVHKSGTKHRVLLKKRQKNPDILSVCFNPVKKVLIVGENSNQLSFFSFLP